MLFSTPRATRVRKEARILRRAAVPIVFAATILGACTTIPAETTSCLYSGCGVHGHCEPRGDTAVCVCDPGHIGPSCSECAPGFQDENHNGSCLEDCTRTACPAHSRCSTASGRALCACVAGYSPAGDG